MIKKLIGLAVIVVVVAGAAIWWFVLRSDEPAELSVDATSGSGTTTSGTVPASLDGTWTVQQGGDTTAGFRITESFAGGLTDHTAVGRTPGVDGSLTIAGSDVTKGSFTVDLTKLAFSDDPGFPVANRVRALETRGLQTQQFPDASFKLTAPIAFGAKPTAGKTVSATAKGDLTLHGVTKPVSFPVQAKIDGGTIRVATAKPVPVKLADYGIDPPTGGPVASVADEGSFEFLIVLVPG